MGRLISIATHETWAFEQGLINHDFTTLGCTVEDSKVLNKRLRETPRHKRQELHDKIVAALTRVYR